MKMKFLLLILLGGVGIVCGATGGAANEVEVANEVLNTETSYLDARSSLEKFKNALKGLEGTDLMEEEENLQTLLDGLNTAPAGSPHRENLILQIKGKQKKIKRLSKEIERRETVFLEAAKKQVELRYRAHHAKLDAAAADRIKELEAAKTGEAAKQHAIASRYTLIKMNQDSAASRERMLKYTVPAVGLGAAGLMTLAFIFKKLSVPRPKIIERGDTSKLSWYERTILKLKVPASRIDSIILSPMKRKMVIDKFASIGQAIKKGLPLSNMLFYGRPGTGKTMAAEAFARRLYEQGLAHYVIIRGGAFKRLNSAGAAQAELANVLRWARTSKIPVILIFDEAESLFLDRSSLIATETSKDLVTTLLSFFPKAVDTQMMFIMCTNRKDDLDPAIISRIDRSLRQEFEAPGEAELIKMLDIYFKEHIVGNGFKIDTALTADKQSIVKMLDGYVGRDIDALMVQALYGVLAQNKKSLDKQTLLEAIKATPPLDVPIEVAA
jgi:AAA+ superfamily predicted ATPase